MVRIITRPLRTVARPKRRPSQSCDIVTDDGPRHLNTSRFIPIAFPINVRAYDETRDSYDALTELLHAAYRPLAEMGLNYVATTQDASVTRARIGAATASWVAVGDDGAIVGTVCYYAGSRHDREPAWYSRAEVGHFGQFAVSPAQQRSGIGAALLRAVEERALADGKMELACDTAEPASHLHAYYARHGFRVVGRHRWPHAVYDSIILSKSLDSTTSFSSV